MNGPIGRKGFPIQIEDLFNDDIEPFFRGGNRT
jgi:hypothetical protein